jgi:hypothetical protein
MEINNSTVLLSVHRRSMVAIRVQVMMDIMDSRVEWRSHRMHTSHKEYRRMEIGDRNRMEGEMDGMYIWAWVMGDHRNSDME